MKTSILPSPYAISSRFIHRRIVMVSFSILLSALLLMVVSWLLMTAQHDTADTRSSKGVEKNGSIEELNLPITQTDSAPDFEQMKQRDEIGKLRYSSGATASSSTTKQGEAKSPVLVNVSMLALAESKSPETKLVENAEHHSLDDEITPVDVASAPEPIEKTQQHEVVAIHHGDEKSLDQMLGIDHEGDINKGRLRLLIDMSDSVLIHQLLQEKKLYVLFMDPLSGQAAYVYRPVLQDGLKSGRIDVLATSGLLTALSDRQLLISSTRLQQEFNRVLFKRQMVTGYIPVFQISNQWDHMINASHGSGKSTTLMVKRQGNQIVLSPG